jgi:hypothetical protein
VSPQLKTQAKNQIFNAGSGYPLQVLARFGCEKRFLSRCGLFTAIPHADFDMISNLIFQKSFALHSKSTQSDKSFEIIDLSNKKNFVRNLFAQETIK